MFGQLLGRPHAVLIFRSGRGPPTLRLIDGASARGGLIAAVKPSLVAGAVATLVASPVIHYGLKGNVTARPVLLGGVLLYAFDRSGSIGRSSRQATASKRRAYPGACGPVRGSPDTSGQELLVPLDRPRQRSEDARHHPDHNGGSAARFAGRTTLDIGAWDREILPGREDGSHARGRAGPLRMGRRHASSRAVFDRVPCRRKLPNGKDLTEFWRPDLPGQTGFKFAKEALGSNVEPVVGDFMTMDLASLGPFDIVLYLGVLYHMKEPLTP